MSICIVGGSGFIGTRLCKRLAADPRVGPEGFTIVDKALGTVFPAQTRVADVRDLPALQAAVGAAKVVVNLAAEHRDDVRPLSLYDEVNVGGARHLCQVARSQGIQTLVFTSSVAVYGFAPLDTDESGTIAPFNDYGRTKYEAEGVLRAWQAEAPQTRTLVVIRPTVVFGEQNRGNVYNLLRQIASGRFLMIGAGDNRKSMAYVENVAAFIQHALTFSPGVHTYNYIDKPDFTMNALVSQVRQRLGKGQGLGLRLPYALGYALGWVADGVSRITGRSLPVSAIRVKKFCANTAFNTSVARTGFIAPVALQDALARTVQHEFLESHAGEAEYFSE